MKRKFVNTILALILVFAFLLSVMSCSETQEPDKTLDDDSSSSEVLTVCINESMIQVLTPGINAFLSENPGVEIEYDVIPDFAADEETLSAERAQVISRIRTEAMSGKGADMYIIALLDSYDTESLIEDANLTMANGVFCDMTPYLEGVGLSGDRFIKPVLEAGQFDGKQYVVPLSYSIDVFLTNDKSMEIMGDMAFDSTENLINGIFALSEVEDFGTRTGTGMDNAVNDLNVLRAVFNPLYRTEPSMVDYDGNTVHVDTPFVRNLLEDTKSLLGVLKPQNTEKMSMEEWQSYASSEKYICYTSSGNYFKPLVYEVGLAEMVGVTPNINAVPSENGGICATIDNYAAVRANSSHIETAAKLIEVLLRPEFARNWPVIKGQLGDAVNGLVYEGGRPWSEHFYDVLFTKSLSQEAVERFTDIENSITEARFTMPVEMNDLLDSYYSGDTNLDAVISEMQSYFQFMLWDAN